MKILSYSMDIYLRLALWVAFVATVAGANWALATFGIVNIGLGLTAPAGVYFAGIAFTLRDLLHERGGRVWILSAILTGAALSGLLEEAQQFAVASGSAFLLSELADWFVYTPLRKMGWALAVVSSNFVGLVVDSILFLWLAFGSLDFIEGQVVGKAYMTIVAITIMWCVRHLTGNKWDSTTTS